MFVDQVENPFVSPVVRELISQVCCDSTINHHDNRPEEPGFEENPDQISGQPKIDAAPTQTLSQRKPLVDPIIICCGMTAVPNDEQYGNFIQIRSTALNNVTQNGPAYSSEYVEEKSNYNT